MDLYRATVLSFSDLLPQTFYCIPPEQWQRSSPEPMSRNPPKHGEWTEWPDIFLLWLDEELWSCEGFDQHNKKVFVSEYTDKQISCGSWVLRLSKDNLHEYMKAHPFLCVHEEDQQEVM